MWLQKDEPYFNNYLNLHINSGISFIVSEIFSVEQLLKTSRLSQKSSLLSMGSLLQSLTVMFSIVQSFIGQWNCKTSMTSEVVLKVMVGVR